MGIIRTEEYEAYPFRTTCVVTPQVLMGFLGAIPLVNAQILRTFAREQGRTYDIAWPSGLIEDQGLQAPKTTTPVASLVDSLVLVQDIRPAYEGGQLRLECAWYSTDELLCSEAAVEAVCSGLVQWETAHKRCPQAGPLGVGLEEYFDALAAKDVCASYRLLARTCNATLHGIDVWGRATLSDEAGNEFEVAPDQGMLRSVFQIS